MATAYAALYSLMNVLNRIQHPHCPVSMNKSEIQTLVRKVSFLVDFLEGTYRGRESKDVEGLRTSRIADTAYAVEDVIESCIVEQIRAESACGRDISQELQKAIQEIDLIREEVMKIRENLYDMARRPGSVSSVVLSSAENPTVGLKEDLVSLMDKLTGHQSSRQIIGVVGMGGIGKTTLARNVYDHPFVQNHFHVRSWVTVSQDYSVEEIILFLLRSIGLCGNRQITEHLGEKLYKGLSGRKYLIVLDDIWSSVAWEEIRRFLPDNGNGSRILLTTRVSNVALAVGTCSPYEMKFLSDDESWDMLSMNVFGQEACPTDLKNLGLQIAKSCKGLPLAITVIGGLLKTSNKARQYWEDVAENVKSIINLENDEHCSRILSLSYNNLPIHLKPCFLYMATFPEDIEISVTRLVRLWVSDGFLKPIEYKTLEEVAIQYLNDLIDRSLIMVRRRGSAGEVKSCVIHDLLWNLCLREARTERFVHVLEDSSKLLYRMENERRFVTSKSAMSVKSGPEVLPLSSTARSFVLSFAGSRWSTSGCSLLRVFQIRGKHNPKAFLHLVNLRYLEFSAELFVQSKYFSSISLLWNLDTLVVDGITWAEEVILPSGIWELQHLRHLIFSERVILSDPVGTHTNLFLENLQTLSRVEDFSCSDEVVNRIPNLKKLSMYYDMSKVSDQYGKLSCCFNNLVRCHKLEILKCFFTPEREGDIDASSYKCVFRNLEALRLSPSLRKFTLWGSNVPWEYMTIVGSLPSLEILKLECNAFCGQQWNPIEGEFERLKYLSIDCCDLATWEAERYHFPRLECLALSNMLKLEEIPSGIGDIMALKSIGLRFCQTSVVFSAMEMLKDQQGQGNDELVIKVHASYSGRAKFKSLMNDNSHFLITFDDY